jgi:hypothetical protein
MSATTSSTESNSCSVSGGRGEGSAAITRSQVVSSRSRSSSGAASQNVFTSSGQSSLPARRRAIPTAPSMPCSRWWTSAESASCISRTDIGTSLDAIRRGTPFPSQRTKVCDNASPTPAGNPIRRETCLVTAQ